MDAPVTGVDQICKQALEYLAAINRTPAVKLLGISPSGFNATGESDIRNYYDHIKSQQEKIFRDAIQRCLDVLQLNLNGKIDKGLSFEFAALSDDDKNAMVSYQKGKADVIGALLDHQIISGEEARKALAADPNSGFNDIDPEEVPEAEGGDDGMGGLMGMLGGPKPNAEQPEESEQMPQGAELDKGAGEEEVALEKKAMVGEQKVPPTMDASLDDVKSWITTETGVHIPIKDGETKKEAVSNFFAEKPSSSTTGSAHIISNAAPGTKSHAVQLKEQEWADKYKDDYNNLITPKDSKSLTVDEICAGLPAKWGGEHAKEFIDNILDFSGGKNWEDMKYSAVIDYGIRNSALKWKDGALYRGMDLSDEEFAEYEVGKEIQMRGVSSFSQIPDVAMDFTGKDEEKTRRVILVDNTEGERNAMSMEKLSKYPDEREVLYAVDQKFKIKSIDEGGAFTYVEVEAV